MENHINANQHLSVKRIHVPVKDKRKLREVLEENEITSVINISRARAPTTNDPDYASRRAAVDFGIPVSVSYVAWGLRSCLVDQQCQARRLVH